MGFRILRFSADFSVIFILRIIKMHRINGEGPSAILHLGSRAMPVPTSGGLPNTMELALTEVPMIHAWGGSTTSRRSSFWIGKMKTKGEGKSGWTWKMDPRNRIFSLRNQIVVALCWTSTPRAVVDPVEVLFFTKRQEMPYCRKAPPDNKLPVALREP